MRNDRVTVYVLVAGGDGTAHGHKVSMVAEKDEATLTVLAMALADALCSLYGNRELAVAVMCDALLRMRAVADESDLIPMHEGELYLAAKKYNDSEFAAPRGGGKPTD